MGGLLALSLAFAAGWEFGGIAKTNEAAAQAAPGRLAKNSDKARGSGKAWSPDDNLADIFSKHTGGERVAAFIALLQKTPVKGLGALIDQLVFCPYPTQRAEFLKLAYAQWTLADPKGALAHALAASRRTGTLDPLPLVFDTWVGLDAPAALQAAQQLANRANRISEINAVLQAWVESDPVTALSALQGLPPGLADYVSFYEHWARTDPQAAFAALNQIANATTRSKTQNAVLSTMANLDPAGAFDLLRKLPPAQQANWVLGNIFKAWAGIDPAAALAAAQSLPVGNARLSAIDSLYAGWAAVEPTAALAAAMELAPGPERDKALAQSFLALTAQNPAAAADFLAAQPLGESRNHMIASLTEKWADTDPIAALAWLQKNSTGDTYNNSFEKILTKMTQTDPGAAMAYIGQMPAGPARDNSQLRAIYAWGAQDPTAAKAWVNNNLTGPVREAALNNLQIRMNQLDPVAALDKINQMPPGSDRDSAVRSLMVPLASQNVNAAINLFQGLPATADPVTRNLLESSIVASMLKVDPAGAASFVQSTGSDPTDPTYQRLVQQVAQQWSASESQAAVKWAETLPDGPARIAAINTTIQALAKFDGPGAWEAVTTYQPDNASAAATVISNWSQTDPTGAAEAFTNYSLQGDDDPESDFRQQAIASIARNWLAQDAQAASQWINTLPTGPARDSAVKILVATQATNDPATALNWAITESSPSSRLQDINDVLVSWARSDLPAAIAAMQAAPLTDQQHNNFLQKLQNAASGANVSPLAPGFGTPRPQAASRGSRGG